MALIDSLIEEGWLKTPEIIKAFKKIKREDFMEKILAEVNEAFPIGHGQTISQPLTVAFMMEELDPRAGQKILDIGSGSGWTAALLSCIAGKKGKVIAIEIIPELKKFGEENAEKYSFVSSGIAKFIRQDGRKGYLKEAPYDRILASASAEKIPENWKKQLKIGGKIVAPVKNNIVVIEKISDKKFKTKEHPGFIFVPLTEE